MIETRWKLAAIDIDDTLVDDSLEISAANFEAIHRLRSTGARVVLASGRSHANMIPFHTALGLDTPLISVNGALVRDVKSGEIWAQHPLPADLVTALIGEGRRLGVSVLLYGLSGTYIDRRTQFTDYDQGRNVDPQIVLEDLLWAPAGEIHKLLWMAEPARITELTPEFTARYHARLTVTHTDPPYLEFMPAGITKGTGLAEVAARYGMDARNVAAFGDGNNDAAMLAWAGTGIAMSHAKPSTKAAADFIVPDAPVNVSLAKGIEWLLDAPANNTESPRT